MPKNIVIACDGTANQFGTENTNIVKLISMMEKNDPAQLVFYDTGVGTLAMPDMATSLKIKTRIKNYYGWFFGTGIKKNVQEAYTFLMNYYEEGDQVFLFGFSRGAYTVRMLAGMINFCGLLPKGNEGQFLYAWDFYRIKKQKTPTYDPFHMGFKFRNNMARAINIKFVGTFDTVSTIGFGPWSKTYPYTLKNSSVEIARHALAVDERRSQYLPKLWMENSAENKIKTNVQQVWFPGAHCDVGGSYKEEASGLSKNALVWMVCEAHKAGLLIHPEKFKVVALGAGAKSKHDYCKPDMAAPIHSEMDHWYFKVLEFFQGNLKWKSWKSGFEFGRPRQIPEGAYLHQSVTDRKNKAELKYMPVNLPGKFEIITDDAECIAALAGGASLNNDAVQPEQ